MRIALLGFATALLASCISVNPGLGEGPPCELVGEDLYLRGDTTEPMLTCLQALPDKPIKRVFVDSNGGPVAVAMPIGDRLAPHHAEFIVRGQCNSSCANYWLPIASRVTVEPGSTVLLHGGIDRAHLAKVAAEARQNLEMAETQFARQTEYAERHDIHPGWLLQREPEDSEARRFGDFLEGAPSIPESEERLSLLTVLVEEQMMRSCLPKVEITPFTDTIAQRTYTEERIAKSLTKQGIFPSGTLVCVARN